MPTAPPLLDAVDLPLPDLPAALHGLRVAHLSDLHVVRPGRRRYRALFDALDALDADLVFLTGDYMCDLGQERPAVDVLAEVCRRIQPRLGVFGVFGNHDSASLRDTMRTLPVRWLENECVPIDGLPLRVLGVENDRHTLPDMLALLGSMRNGDTPNRDTTIDDTTDSDTSPAVTLLLSHYPTLLSTAADMSVNVMFSGHTHGGQWRLPGRVALYTSCDLPGRLAAGILRHRDTLAAISRGLGETWVPIRFFCPPHLPVYTLKPGDLPGERSEQIENVQPW